MKRTCHSSPCCSTSLRIHTLTLWQHSKGCDHYGSNKEGREASQTEEVQIHKHLVHVCSCRAKTNSYFYIFWPQLPWDQYYFRKSMHHRIHLVLCWGKLIAGILPVFETWFWCHRNDEQAFLPLVVWRDQRTAMWHLDAIFVFLCLVWQLLQRFS